MSKKRIQIIKNTAANLKRIKKSGLDLSREYSKNEWLYDDKQKRFGKIICSNKFYFMATFDETDRVYFRRAAWSPCKEQFLKDFYRKKTNKELARLVNCSEKIIEKKLSKLSLKRNFEWDQDKDAFLIKNIEQSNNWLSEQLGTSVSSIKGRIYRLKTKGLLPYSKKRVAYNWTEKDDQFIVKNLDQSNQWLADHFGLKVSNIKSRLRKLREQGLITQARKRGKKKKTSK